MTDVRICIPFGHDFEHAKSGLRDLKHLGEARRSDVFKYAGYNFDIEPRHSSPDMAAIRNDLLTDNKRDLLNYDFFFFVDSDIVWKIKDLLKLLKHNTELCCAPYLRRSGGEYCCGRWDGDTYTGKAFKPTETGFKLISFTGAGFLLIAKHALEKMPYPYFRNILYKHPEGGLDQLSEDYSFCAMAKEAGLRIWCDFDINIVHKPKKPVPGDWVI